MSFLFLWMEINKQATLILVLQVKALAVEKKHGHDPSWKKETLTLNQLTTVQINS